MSPAYFEAFLELDRMQKESGNTNERYEVELTGEAQESFQELTENIDPEEFNIFDGLYLLRTVIKMAWKNRDAIVELIHE